MKLLTDLAAKLTRDSSGDYDISSITVTGSVGTDEEVLLRRYAALGSKDYRNLSEEIEVTLQVLKNKTLKNNLDCWTKIRKIKNLLN
jgi:hypothetical protein